MKLGRAGAVYALKLSLQKAMGIFLQNSKTADLVAREVSFPIALFSSAVKVRACL